LACLISGGCGGDKSAEKPSPTVNSGAKHVSDPPSEPEMHIQTEPYGQTASGEPIVRYLLSNAKGMKVEVINFGAIVTAVSVPDRNGEFRNVTLAFDDLAGYEANAPYFGAICGRYANRIAKGKFKIDGTEYTLATNNGPNHLHGGLRGFNKAVWRAEEVPAANGAAGVRLKYDSPDGEEGYPGKLQVTVAYSLTDENELKIDYTAVSDKATPLNLTNHCYWNLAGTGDILGHELTLNCDKYLPVDATAIPTGERKDVKGTPMDFTQPAAIGSRIAQVDGGYDHCYVINGGGKELTRTARVVEPKSGRVMEILTTEPGVQLYTGNFLAGDETTAGVAKHGGFCLECQHFPDSPNHPEFPSTILQPGQVYQQSTVHRFSTVK
jgi:aldose 1-epimerase